MPQHTRLVTCHQNAKAIHYKWKFINSKEIGRQEPSGTHSSHRDQVPMISPVGEHGFNDQKQVKSKRGRNLIRNLKIDDNTTLNTDEEILSEAKRFYQALLTRQTIVLFKKFLVKTFFQQENHCTISDDERKLCEGLLTAAECLGSLKTMESNKTPGADGIPVEFYKVF